MPQIFEIHNPCWLQKSSVGFINVVWVIWVASRCIYPSSCTFISLTYIGISQSLIEVRWKRRGIRYHYRWSAYIQVKPQAFSSAVWMIAAHRKYNDQFSSTTIPHHILFPHSGGHRWRTLSGKYVLTEYSRADGSSWQSASDRKWNWIRVEKCVSLS